MISKKLHFVFLFINLIIGFNKNYSQEKFDKIFNVDNGLLSSDNYMSYNDSEGFMWFCSEKGLAKFDGTNFKYFTVKDGLPNNDIWYINQDVNGKLWLGGFFKGLYYIHNDSVFNTNISNDISALLYTATIKDTLYFSSITNKKSYYFYKNELKENNFKNKDFYILNIDNNNIAIYHKNKREGVFGAKVSKNDSIFFSKANYKNWGRLIQNFDKQFLRYTNYMNDKWTIFSDTEIKNIDTETYFGGKITKAFTLTPTKKVFVIINDSARVYKNLFTKERDFILEQKLQAFVNKNISWITLDNEENLWVTLYRGNVIFVPFNSHLIKKYFFNNEVGNNIRNISKSGNKIYFNSLRGHLLSYEIETKRIEQIYSIENETEKVSSVGFYNDNLYFITNSIFAIKEKLDFKIYRKEPNTLGIHPGKVIIEEKNIIISSNLVKYKFQNEKLSILDKDNQINDRIKSFINTKDIAISGGSNGLYFHNRKTSTTKKINIKDVRSLQFFNNNILVGTNGFGLHLLNFDGEIISKSHIGLSINDIEILNKKIYLATNKGILIDTLNGSDFINIKILNKSDGLSSTEVNSIALVDNILYAGTINGFNAIDIESINLQQSPKPIIEIDKLFVNDEYTRLGYQSFQSNENNIKIDFTGISFYSLGNIKYKFRLLGLSENWSETKKNEIRYWSLPAGEYTFEVKAINANGIESEKTASLKFKINKHFTQTIWFSILILIFSLITLAFILRYYQKRERKKLMTEKKFAELEMQALQSQMNPHFIFNSLNAIQSVMFLKGEKETNKYIGAFSKLMRLTLDNSKKSIITLENEIEYLKSYIDLEERRLNNNLNTYFNVSEEIRIEEIQIPSMIFQPLVENAIIHGLIPKKENKILTINFFLENNFLVGEVIDNGIGRKKAEKNKKSKKYKSWASTILKEKVEVLNRLNKLKVEYYIEDLKENGIAKGTKITIKLPLEI